MRFMKKSLCSLCVFAVSFFMVLLWGGFNPEAYLVDDNRTQWYPILERAYSELFAYGRLPIYDFFEMKGLAIAEPGYYGIVNPVMLISYMLANFTPLPFSTITIHIALLFSLGNVCFFWLCHTLGQKLPAAALLTAAYSVSSVFFAFSHWYYVYNNYLFVPLLIWVFLKSRERKSAYFGCGLVLALEILFGNVQYTCYHYMVYGLICLVYVILKEKRYIGIFLSNVLCAGVLSSPFLLLMMRTSDDFGGSEFRTMKITFAELLLGALVPTGILGKIGISHFPFRYKPFDRVDFAWLYNGGLAAIWVVLLIGAILWLVKKKEQLRSVDYQQNHTLKEWWVIISRTAKKLYHERIEQKDDGHLVIISVSVCALFFISFINNGMVAFLLNKMPVINHFRFLFKCVFVLVPLLAILTASVLRFIPKKLKNAAMIACCVFTAIGLVNNYAAVDASRGCYTDAHSLTIAEEIEHGEAIKQSYFPDSDTFRSITLLRSNLVTVETFHYHNGFLRNFSTTMGLYSMCGYEISAPRSHLEQFSGLYPVDGFTRMVNAGFSERLIEEIERDPERISEQLASNAVKYIFVQKSGENIDFSFYMQDSWEDVVSRSPNVIWKRKEESRLNTMDFTALVTESLGNLEGITIADIRSVNDYYDVIELAGTRGLCTDTSANALPITSERMDLLSFEANGSPEYTLSFAYEEGLTAYTLDTAGNRTALTIRQAEDGNTIIHAPAELNGRIYLGYEDLLTSAGFVFEAVIVVLFLGMLLMVGAHAKSNEADRKGGEAA